MLLTFDVGNRASFEHALTYWADELERHATPGTAVVLVGTKIDLVEDEGGYRQVMAS